MARATAPILFGLRARTSTTTIRSSSRPFTSLILAAAKKIAAGEDVRRPLFSRGKLLLWVVASSAMLRLSMGLGLRIRIVLIVIDRTANVVLPLIDLLVFLRRQGAAIRSTIIRNLAIDARLAVLDVAGLARRHLPGTNPLANPLLLVVSPLPRSRESRVLRTPAVHRSKITAIPMRHLHMVLLFHCGAKMVLPRKRSLSLILTRLNAASP